MLAICAPKPLTECVPSTEMARDAEDRAYVEYVKRSLNEEEEFHFQRFEFLQRLNLAQLQAKLVRLKSLIQASNCVSEEDLVTLQETLHNYGTNKADGPASYIQTKAKLILAQARQSVTIAVSRTIRQWTTRKPESASSSCSAYSSPPSTKATLSSRTSPTSRMPRRPSTHYGGP